MGSSDMLICRIFARQYRWEESEDEATLWKAVEMGDRNLNNVYYSKSANQVLDLFCFAKE